MPLRDTLETVGRNLRQGRYPNEQAVSMMVVLPVLADLGWDTRNPDLVWPEYALQGGRVDYALCFPGQHPKVFIEVKQPGRAEGADAQLADYAAKRGVRLAILSDGQSWSFYLPTEEGSFEERRVYRLDLGERSPEEAAEQLHRYLAQPRVANNSAIDEAVAELRDRGRRTLALKTIPQAWAELVEDEEPTLVDLLSKQVEAKCGIRPELDDVARFLNRLGSQPAISAPQPIARIQPPPRPPPPSGPLGFTLGGASFPCHNAKDVMIGLLQKLAERNPRFCEDCYGHPDNRGRSRTYISRNREELYLRKDFAFAEAHSEEFVPGWFVGTNFSNPMKDKVIRMACKVAGLTIGVDITYNLG
jgi:hypothetical protein